MSFHDPTQTVAIEYLVSTDQTKLAESHELRPNFVEVNIQFQLSDKNI